MNTFKKTLLGLLILFIVVLIIDFIPENRKEIKTQHFTFHFSSNINERDIDSLSATLESNYFRVGNDLNTLPSEHIDINIYSSRWRYAMATKNWGGSGNIEGVSKIHFMDQAWSETDNKKVAVHEFAHTLTLKLLIDNEPRPLNNESFDKKFSQFPTWLWEAISVYEAKQFVDPKSLPYLKNGLYPSISELNNRMKGGKIYNCGYTLMEYILSKYGKDSLILLVKNYGDLKMTLGISEEEFSEGWHAFLRQQYLN